MHEKHRFSREELLTIIQEAEALAARIETLQEGQEQMRLIYRWATTADGIAKLMVQAEELLSEDELQDLQATVNAHDRTRWDTYRRNIRWLNNPPD